MQLNDYQRPQHHYWLLAVSAGLLVSILIIWLMTQLITPQTVTPNTAQLLAIEFIQIQPARKDLTRAEMNDTTPAKPPELPAPMNIPAFDMTITQAAQEPMLPLAIEQPVFSADIERPVFKPMAVQSDLEPPAFDEALYPVQTSKPVYPSRAKRAGIEGWVNVAFTITTEGTVRDIEILAAQPQGVFENTTLNTIKHWRYKPQLLSGKPTARRVMQTIKFELAP